MFPAKPVDFFLSGSQPLPSPSQVVSPLKRRAQLIEKIGNSNVCRSLFGEKKQKIEDQHEVSSLMANSEILRSSSLLSLQVEVIEKHLELNSMSIFQKSAIRLMIHQILRTQSSEECKLIELGLFYYDLTRGKKIPEGREGSFLAKRIAEIEFEMRALDAPKDCSLGEGGKELPTAHRAYLIRALVKMIFPSDGGLNLGGCYAVVALLKTRLNTFVTEEMRSQILKIIHRLVGDPDFRELFQKPFQVHSDMEELICIDLMMPLTEKKKMNFVYVRWSMLSALFSLIGQIDEINCFAVAKVMNLQSEHPEVLVKLMIEVLKQGGIYYEKTSIPISPLLESRRRYELDFEEIMTASEARSLPSYAITRFALQSTDPFLQVPETKKQMLGDWMQFDFKEHVGLAKQFFLSLKLSFLQQTILAILQFGSLNSTEKIRGSDSYKMDFINAVMSLIRKRIKKQSANPIQEDPGLKDFMDNFFYSLQTAFFCIDFTHWDHTIKDERVVFDYHSQGFIFEGNFDDYEPYRDTRRLFYASGDAFEPVDSLSGFAKICQELVKEVGTEINCPYITDFQRILSKDLKSKEFLHDLAKLIDSMNQEESGLDWKDYAEADSLFLIQNGGLVNCNGDFKTLKGKFCETYKINTKTLDVLFISLCSHFHVLAGSQKEGSRRFGSLVLGSNKDHVFNWVPFRFEKYWKNPIWEIQGKLLVPGGVLLSSPLSLIQMSKVLQHAFGHVEAEELLQEIGTQERKVGDFQAVIHQSIGKKYRQRFNAALRDVVQEVDYTLLMRELLYILRAQGAELNPSAYQEVVQEMEVKKEEGLNAYEAAQLIQMALIKSSESIFVPIKNLEDTICQRFGLPEVVEIANLNWMKYNSDHTVFTYLVMFYDIAQQKINFGKRMQGNLIPLSLDETEEFQNCEFYLNRRDP